MLLDELLVLDECPWFDRKRQFPPNRVDLVHDLLCLINSYHDGDRFLVFGQADTREIIGIENDPQRLNSAGLHDLLRQSHLNRLPTLELRIETVNGHEIDVVRIKNRPDKPFYLTRDKTHQGRTVRAGVVYTRLGDTNIPLDASAPEEMIELMWRERFGLGLDPLSRFHKLLDEPAEWVELPGEDYRYHRRFPEFTIQDSNTVVEDFRESWSEVFPDPRAWSYYKEVRYLSTVLARMLFVDCDGGRYHLPAPTRRDDGSWYVERESPAMKLAAQLPQYMPLQDTFPRIGVDIV